MTKEVIVLNQVGLPSDFNLTVLYWIAIVSDRQSFYKGLESGSQWPGASSAENLAIANGQIYEIAETATFVAHTTLAAVEAALLVRWNYWQTFFNNNNPYGYYGSYYDGVTGWTIVTSS